VIAEPAKPAPEPEPEAPTRTFGVDVVLTTGGKVIFVLCGALMTVIIARQLGPGGQGTFAVAFSLTLLLVQVGSIGLPVSNPYFAAREVGAQRAIVLHSLWIAVVVGLGLAAATVLVKAAAPDLLRGLSWTQLAITVSALPAALATVYLQGVTLGQQRMAWFATVDITQVGTSLIAIVVVFLVAEPSLDVVLAIVAGGRYLALLVALFALRGVLRGEPTPTPGLVRRMLGHAARVYVVSLLSFALIRLDLLIVNAVLGSEDTGQYSIAAYITEALTVIPSVIATNMLPRIAKSDDLSMTAAVVRTVTVLWGVLCLLSVPAAVIGIPIVFGHRYDEAVTLYVLLAPATFFLGMTSALTAHYWVRGYPRSLIAAWTAGLVLNVVANVALLDPLGVEAAPVISTLTYAGVLAVHLIVFAREAGSWRPLRPRPGETLHMLRAAFGR
jgi:O-antigen/teichoic acid export membrane protein